MMLLHATALLLLVCGLWNSASASTAPEGAIDCCLTTSDTPIPRRLVKSYALQTPDSGCRIEATIFTTKKNRKLCAPLPSDEKWVRDLIKKVGRGKRTPERGGKPSTRRNGKSKRHRGKNGRN